MTDIQLLRKVNSCVDFTSLLEKLDAMFKHYAGKRKSVTITNQEYLEEIKDKLFDDEFLKLFNLFFFIK
jgi:hypothetical protein